MLHNTLFKAFAITAMTAFAAVDCAHAAATDVKITEWMYNPANSPGEYVEFTNLGSSAIDFTGWSYSDSTEVAGSVSLSGFGIVQAGESVILTEASIADFRTAWNLSGSVKIIGGNTTQNLGRSDEINLYDAGGNLIDRLTFNDQGSGTVKSPRTAGVSANPGSANVIGANNASLWTLSTLNDAQGSYASVAVGKFTAGDIGNPGKTSYAAAPAVPLPAALPLWLSAMGLMGTVSRLRRRR